MARYHFILALLTVLGVASSLSAQATPGITVAAKLVDGQGNVMPTAYLHFQLYNCGPNVPQVIGAPDAIVAQQFDLRPATSGATISGAVWGNNQILCGGVQSTQWIVTVYKSTGQIGVQPQNYCLTAPGTFDPSSTQPCSITPPAPGFIALIANPIASQTWNQPTGTKATFLGTFDFTNAIMLGVSGGGTGGGGGTADGTLDASLCGTTNKPGWCAGSDIGAWINAAEAYLPTILGGSHCGTVYVPAGVYTWTTTINRSRCVNVTGAGVGATWLQWSGTATYAVVDGDTGSSLAQGGFNYITLAGNNGGVVGAGSNGIFLGTDPSGIITPANNFSVNQVNQELQLTQWNIAIYQGNNTWAWHCDHCAINLNTEAIKVGSTVNDSGENMGIENSNIFNNYSLVLDEPNEWLTLVAWRFDHDSIDYNGNCANSQLSPASSCNPIFNGGFFINDSHVEQASGPFWTNVNTDSPVISNNTNWVITGTDITVPYLGSNNNTMYSLFSGDQFFVQAGSAITNLFAGASPASITTWHITYTGTQTCATAVGDCSKWFPSHVSDLTGNIGTQLTWTSAPRLSGVDMNTVTACGFYDGTGMTDAPSYFGSGFFHFVVLCSNDATIQMQMAFDMVSTNRTFIRRHESGTTWSPWVESLMPDDSGNLDVGGTVAFTPNGAGTAGGGVAPLWNWSNATRQGSGYNINNSIQCGMFDATNASTITNAPSAFGSDPFHWMNLCSNDNAHLAQMAWDFTASNNNFYVRRETGSGTFSPWVAVQMPNDSGLYNFSGNIGAGLTWTDGIRLGSGTDLNTITACGYYDISGAVDGPTAFGSNPFGVEVVCSYDTNYLQQYAWDMNGTNNVWERHRYAGTWYNWEQLLMPDNGGNFTFPATNITFSGIANGSTNQCLHVSAAGWLSGTGSDCGSGSSGMTNPMTAVGDTIIGGTGGTPTRLAGNTAANDAVLTSTGTGSATQAQTYKNAPALSAANMTNFPSSLETVSAAQSAFSGAGACSSKVVTAANANAAPTCTTVTSAYVDTSVCSTAACSQNTTGTAAALGVASALPNGTTATTQANSDSSTKVATTAYVQNQAYAPLASPALTGTPTSPTPGTSDSSTKIATTAWVNAQGYGTGSGNVTGPSSSTSGHIATFSGTNGKTIQDSGIAANSLAPLASPGLTGTPTAPTQATTDNSTDIATDAFVQNALATLNALATMSLSGGPGYIGVSSGGTPSVIPANAGASVVTSCPSSFSSGGWYLVQVSASCTVTLPAVPTTLGWTIVVANASAPGIVVSVAPPSGTTVYAGGTTYCSSGCTATALPLGANQQSAITVNSSASAYAGNFPGGHTVAPLASLLPCVSATEGIMGRATNCSAACSSGGTCTASGTTHCTLQCNGSAYVETGW
jgi:hypothetical protein